MNTEQSLFLICAGLLAVWGCDAHKKETADSSPSEDAVLVACATKTYCRAEWDCDVAASVRLACAGLARNGKTPDAKFRAKTERHARKASLQNAINYLLVRSSALGRDFESDPETLKRVQDRYSRGVFQKKGKFEEIAELVSPEDYREIEELARRTSVVEGFLQKNYAPRFKVKDSEIDVAWSNVVALSEMADKTNQTLMATAREVTRRARAGEDFTRLVHQYSQDANSDENGFIEEKTESDFSSDKPAVWTAVSRLKPGEVSEPLDSEEGLSVFKLVRIEGPNDDHPDEEHRILQRVVFHRMLKYPFETKEDLAVSMRDNARLEMGAAAVKELVAENPVTFPSGVEGFSRDLLVMLRAYSKEIVVPQAKGLSGALLKAIKMRRNHEEP